MRFALLLGSSLVSSAIAITHDAKFARPPLEERIDSSPACRITITSQRPLTIARNRRLYIHPQGVAENGKRLAISGVPTFLWSASGASSGNAPRPDSLLGVVIDAQGIATVVPSPLDGTVVDPRVASAGARGWHFLLVEPLARGGKPDLAALDSAALWHGVFDGRGWSDLERIQVTQRASVLADLSSELLADGNEIAFAYPFNRALITGSNRRGNQGVVLIRGRRGTWKFDTLHTLLGPTYARLSKDPLRPFLRAVVIQAYFDAGRLLRASSVFLATYDRAWNVPQLIGGDGNTPVRQPTLLVSGDHGVITWLSSTQEQGIEWARVPLLAAANSVVVRGTVSRSSLGYSAVAVGSSRVVWFARNRSKRSLLMASMLDGDRITQLPALDVPNDAYNFPAVALSDSQLVLVSSELNAAKRPPATTFLTNLRLRCREVAN